MSTLIPTPHTYQPSPQLLRDRVIVVTGATDDLGRAAAFTFARHGATVVLLGGATRQLEKLYDDIVASGAPKPAAIPMNQTEAAPAIYDELALVLRKEFSRVDGLLHAAFEPGALAPIEHFDFDVWSRVLQVNLTGRFLLTRALLPLLKSSPDASVVFTSTDVAEQSRAYWGAFSAAAAGTRALMQTLSAELEENTAIRVNAIDPGPTRGFLRSRFYPGEDNASLPRAEDIMLSFLYLIGPDSRPTSGSTFKAQS